MNTKPSSHTDATSPQGKSHPLPTHAAQALPLALERFDQLPDSAFVRQPIVERLFAYSSATVWRRVADCRIPKPRKVSDRFTVWNVGQPRAALASVLSGRRFDVENIKAALRQGVQA
jgi:predicted DNA-binding transcriptional regulator AlpA